MSVDTSREAVERVASGVLGSGDPVGASDGSTFYLRSISPVEMDQIAATLRALLAERDALIHDIERAKESESSLLAELEQARGIARQGSRVNSGSCQSRCHAPSGRNW